MGVSAHGLTHPGRRRTNEDAMLVDAARGLFIVADGMGGHNAGEVASALAVESIQQALVAGGEASEQALTAALDHANDEVLQAGFSRPEYSGMGTTVVAAHVTPTGLVFGSVGDSRIYHWHEGTLTQLTCDDSWLEQVLRDEGRSPAEAQNHPMRHVLTKVVGLCADMEPAVGARPFDPGDLLLLCSDGLHGTLPDDRIGQMLGSRKPVETIAQQLVDEALGGGASDNITVVVVRRE